MAAAPEHIVVPLTACTYQNLLVLAQQQFNLVGVTIDGQAVFRRALAITAVPGGMTSEMTNTPRMFEGRDLPGFEQQVNER